MPNPIDRLTELRKDAVFRLFNTKFKARMRITVGSATCENAAGAVAVHQRFAELIQQHGCADEVVLGRVGCAGRCDMEPVVTMVPFRETPVKYIHMTPAKVDEVFENHIRGGRIVEKYTMRNLLGIRNAKRVVALCGGSHCLKNHSLEIEKAFAAALERHGLDKSVVVTRSACQGLCEHGPIAFIYPDGVTYHRLTPAIAERIVAEHFAKERVVAEHTWTDNRLANRFFPIFGDVHFFSKQLRLTLRNCGIIDPESLDEYLAVRGYEAIAHVLATMTPAAVVDAITLSGLRGRGGAGFSTGMKWKMGATAKGDQKFIICNADEGDPGAFMDRSTIEGDPHTIIEGMMIGARAIGAARGYIYIRAEYPLAISRLERALADARAAGLLGKNILGTDWDFDITLRLGAGAFVCGEESALIKSIEGERGMPRPRPPYPTQAGLWGYPTVINNVETFANIPVIILDGPEWFRTLGAEKSKGTKVFALAGKVNNNGLIEVPMGTTLREVVYDIGGGIKDGKEFKAVQTGGPAGGCLPASALDTPIDYDSLAAAGSIMGSGGMIVIDNETCIVDVAKFFLEFTQSESCGKCTPCREGTKRMLEILQRITAGQGKLEDLDKLLRLADTIKKTSLCGLGQAAPNPVISTIKHFRDEYEAHIRDRRCPAGSCKSLLRYEIIPDKCVGCGACRKKCPVNCIAGKPKTVHEINQAACIKCGNCLAVCKFNAVKRT